MGHVWTAPSWQGEIFTHEAAFRDNKVDAAVLPKLTADDLKDLGIAAVGDRRKLLKQ